MQVKWHPILVGGGFVVLASAMAACHGGTTGNTGYLPTANGQAASAQRNLVNPDAVKIHSSCGTSLTLTAGVKASCKFSETGYSGRFTIAGTDGHVRVSPRRGTKRTAFHFTAISKGRASFIVRDKRNHKLTLAFAVRGITRGGAIASSCGNDIALTLAGVVDCKFSQKDFKGTFTIANNLNGIASVSPSSGTSGTTFTVAGLLAGGGNFVVHGGHGKKLTVKVTISL